LAEIRISFQVNAKGDTETFLNNLNVEKKIRKMRVSEAVSEVSALHDVRRALVEQQRRLGRERGIVMDGRDIGSVVFPNAELKLFLTADILVRAFRRQRELLEKDDLVDLDAIMENLLKRDEIDSLRKESPLVRAKDAILIDTSYITIDEQVDEVIRLALSRMIRVPL
jgi:CMP/dCMP kinase